MLPPATFSFCYLIFFQSWGPPVKQEAASGL